MVAAYQIVDVAAVVLDVVVLEPLDALWQFGAHVREGLVAGVEYWVARLEAVQRSAAAQEIGEGMVPVLDGRAARTVPLQGRHPLE